MVLSIINYILIILIAFAALHIICADYIHILVIINDKVVINYSKNMEVDLTIEDEEEEENI